MALLGIAEKTCETVHHRSFRDEGTEIRSNNARHGGEVGKPREHEAKRAALTQLCQSPEAEASPALIDACLRLESLSQDALEGLAGRT